MKIVYSTKPENKSGFILLLLAVLAIIILFFIVIEEGDILFDLNIFSEITIIVVLLFILMGWVYYFLDEAIWQLLGEEDCECNDEILVITKRRLFKRKKVIRWSDITHITEYVPNKIVQIFTYCTITGVSQNTILIQYGEGKQYRCGVNLKKKQIQNSIKMLIRLRNNNIQKDILSQKRNVSFC